MTFDLQMHWMTSHINRLYFRPINNHFLKPYLHFPFTGHNSKSYIILTLTFMASTLIQGQVALTMYCAINRHTCMPLLLRYLVICINYRRCYKYAFSWPLTLKKHRLTQINRAHLWLLPYPVTKYPPSSSVYGWVMREISWHTDTHTHRRNRPVCSCLFRWGSYNKRFGEPVTV